MAGNHRSKYGIKRFPAKATDIEIELACYRHNKLYRQESDKVFPAVEHFINAVRMLYTNEQLTWNSWTEEHAFSFVNDKFAVIWGPGSASKSNDYGCFVVVDWWADPANTYTAVCSTTSAMLQKRIWEAVLRYHSYHKKNPGTHKRSLTAITLGKGESESDSIKPGIHGFAVLSGTKDESEANIVGVHLPRVRLVVDEMQSTRRAAVDARHNLSKGVEEFKFFGLCNPTSFLNIAGEYSEPFAGWDTVDVDTDVWDTRWGKCYHFDGHKSPAVVDKNGAKKYPYLINQEQIDEAAKDGVDSANYWTYVRGWPPSSGAQHTVLTENACISYGIYEHPTWANNRRMKAATLDPSYGGEDKCPLKIWDCGIATTGIFTAELLETFYLDIKVSDPMPPTHQLATQVKNVCDTYGIEPKYFAIDESATQTSGDMVEEIWKRGIIRVDFGRKPLEGLKNADVSTRCEDEYFNMISSLYLQFAEFARFNHIKGLDKQSAIEICRRVVLPGRPARILDKKEYKKLMGRSPDDGDAAVMLAVILRKAFGVIPGSVNHEMRRQFTAPQQQNDFDIDGSDSNYLDSSL